MISGRGYEEILTAIRDPTIKQETFDNLDELNKQFELETSQRRTRKFNNLYGGIVCLPQETTRYVNLSTHQLTPEPEELLSLGPKFPFKRNFALLTKNVENEMLFYSLLKVSEKNIISIYENLKPQLLAESTRNRDYTFSKVITKKLNDAAKDLKEHKEIIVRRTEKSKVFGVMVREDYFHKLDEFLSNTEKISVVTRNPTVQLKTEVNKLIKSANEQFGQTLLKPIVGEFKPS